MSSDWDFIYEFGGRHGAKESDVVSIYHDAMDYPFRKQMHQQGPLDYQDMVFAITRILMPNFVVETGVRHGVCSSFILAALAQNGLGQLDSCDPMWSSQEEACRRIHELICTPVDLFDRWSFYPMMSSTHFHDPDWLADVVMPRGVDLFVHDSDHGFGNMMWELEWALEHCNKGGVIICDDWDWQENEELEKHADGNVVRQFCAGHRLTFSTIGTAAVIEL